VSYIKSICYFFSIISYYVLIMSLSINYANKLSL